MKRRPPPPRKTKSPASAVIMAAAAARWETKQTACFAAAAPSPLDAAGMLEKFEAADGETFESVVYAAADKLHVDVI